MGTSPGVARSLLVAAALVVGVAVAAGAAVAEAAGGKSGAVYTLTNSAAGNAVLVFDRAGDGTLTPAGAVPTGGLGSGAGLGSQNAVALSHNGKRLFAVNAGDNTISAFRVKHDGLDQLGGPVSSGGVNPISLTVHGHLLYVLNAGGGGSPGNITGFEVEHDGLDPIAGSTRPLSGASVGPAQVQFSPNGKLLVVTEKATNLIDTYVVGSHGLVSGPNPQASAAATPFGFAFDKHGDLIVSDAVGGSPGASGLSSYDVSKSGVLTAITPFLGDTQTAACWVVTTKDGRFAYTTNTGSNTISTYRIDDGSLSLRNPTGATTGAGPIDAALSSNSQYLYALVAGAINAYSVAKNGALTPISGAGGLAAGAVGLAAT
jgi:6-phosphogluconolactonase (cycloisomerase 2 family)